MGHGEADPDRPYPKRTKPYLQRVRLADELDALEAEAEAVASTARTEARMHVIEALREVFL